MNSCKTYPKGIRRFTDGRKSVPAKTVVWSKDLCTYQEAPILSERNTVTASTTPAKLPPPKEGSWIARALKERDQRWREKTDRKSNQRTSAMSFLEKIRSESESSKTQDDRF